MNIDNAAFVSTIPFGQSTQFENHQIFITNSFDETESLFARTASHGTSPCMIFYLTIFAFLSQHAAMQAKFY